MKSFLFLAAILLVSVCSASHVLDLDDTNFKSTVDDNEFVLVEFFAPWCGHCKALAPEYEKAAETLADSTVKLAKVDCTQYADLCQDYEVRGYPTLKFFKSGTAREYNGPRQAQGIVDWLKSKTGPAYHTLANAEEVSTFTKNNENSVYLLGHFAADSDAAKAFIDAKQDERAENWVFGLVTAADKQGTVVLHRTFDADVTFDKEGFSATELVDWASEHAHPYVGEVSANYERLAKRGLPIALCFVDDEPEALEKVLSWLKPIAQSFYSKISFAHVGKAFHSRLAQLGASGEKIPTYVIMDSVGKRWPFDETVEFNKENVEKHITGMLDGSVKPHFKSEAVPETNDEPVKVVVGKTFDSIVLDPTKNVLLEFYAPWCGHCKTLVPIWNQVGEHFKDSKDVVIAKIDATANDNPSVQIQGFPTIYFFPAGDKTNPIQYQDARSAEAIISFVEAQVNGEAAEEPEAKEEKTKGTKDEL